MSDKAFEGEKESNKSNKDLELLDKKFSGPTKRKKKRPKHPQANAQVTEKTKPEGRSSHKNQSRSRKGRMDPKNLENKKPNIDVEGSHGANQQEKTRKDPENRGHGRKKSRPRNRWRNSQNRNNPNDGKP